MERHPLEDHLYRKIRWTDLSAASLQELIRRARNEDLLGEGLIQAPAYSGDLTSAFIGEREGRAQLVAREPLTLCGIELIPLIVSSYGDGCFFEPMASDGDSLSRGTVFAEIAGRASLLLEIERVVLNFIQHLSGIATMTQSFVQALGDSQTKLLDTRKTTPGYRLLEKYAVACGGGWNHRLGLFDRVLFKDNHWASGCEGIEGGVVPLVQQFRREYPKVVVEVEVDHLSQVSEVINAEVDVVLFDNFSLKDTQTAIREVDGRILTEASGNVSLSTLPQFGALGLDFISCGAITHQSKWVDIGMDWIK